MMGTSSKSNWNWIDHARAHSVHLERFNINSSLLFDVFQFIGRCCLCDGKQSCGFSGTKVADRFLLASDIGLFVSRVDQSSKVHGNSHSSGHIQAVMASGICVTQLEKWFARASRHFLDFCFCGFALAIFHLASHKLKSLILGLG